MRRFHAGLVFLFSLLAIPAAYLLPISRAPLAFLIPALVGLNALILNLADPRRIRAWLQVANLGLASILGWMAWVASGRELTATKLLVAAVLGFGLVVIALPHLRTTPAKQVLAAQQFALISTLGFTSRLERYRAGLVEDGIFTMDHERLGLTCLYLAPFALVTLSNSAQGSGPYRILSPLVVFVVLWYAIGLLQAGTTLKVRALEIAAYVIVATLLPLFWLAQRAKRREPAT